jgi:uncharacterized protein YecT (DUF1311 family)
MRLSSWLRSTLLAAPLALASPALASPAPATKAAAASCLDTATTTVQIQACAAAERKQADTELATVYGELRAKLPAERKVKLNKSQQTWLAFRTAHCGFVASASTGGTSNAQDTAFCLAAVTRTRVTELRQALEAASR